ncbi:DMT family transporter [Evansella halocellulosilytica]|uniref:DMT family transporter n=1 Tax=Evansella halocellulosilytica TaxID=2011013 RepID=UPI000BB9A3FF|nr:DMT family transporter [Evansella halocellulosilytica]
MFRKRELLYIHLAVLLFGFSGLFAEWVTLSALLIVFGRVIFASFFLLVVLVTKNEKVLLQSKRQVGPFLLLGALLALHWWSFFHAIQLSTVAVGLITFATFPIFASFLEPIVFKEPFQRKNIIFAILTFIGILIIVSEFHIGSDVTYGALWGIVSACTFACLSIANRKFVVNTSSIQIGFYQNLFAAICLSPLLFNTSNLMSIEYVDILLLILLGIVFTGCAHVLYIQGLSKINVRTASIIVTLEPVYGIVAAMMFLKQFPVLREWIGITLIIAVVMYVSWKKGMS